jgi:hypothetical protein
MLIQSISTSIEYAKMKSDHTDDSRNEKLGKNSLITYLGYDCDREFLL